MVAQHYADARKNNGDWLLRIDDIDQARVIKDSDQHILSTLEQCGFEWDETVTYQSHSIKQYQEALEILNQSEMTYPCTCSRKQINSPIYLGTCRDQSRKIASDEPYAIRIKVPKSELKFSDQIQSDFRLHLGQVHLHSATGGVGCQGVLRVVPHAVGVGPVVHCVVRVPVVWESEGWVALGSLAGVDELGWE